MSNSLNNSIIQRIYILYLRFVHIFAEYGLIICNDIPYIYIYIYVYLYPIIYYKYIFVINIDNTFTMLPNYSFSPSPHLLHTPIPHSSHSPHFNQLHPCIAVNKSHPYPHPNMLAYSSPPLVSKHGQLDANPNLMVSNRKL